MLSAETGRSSMPRRQTTDVRKTGTSRPISTAVDAPIGHQSTVLLKKSGRGTGVDEDNDSDKGNMLAEMEENEIDFDHEEEKDEVNMEFGLGRNPQKMLTRVSKNF